MKTQKYLIVEHTTVIQLVKSVSEFLLLLFEILIVAVSRIGQGWQEASWGLT